MTCDLEQIYGPFADTFPTVADGNHYILLSKKNLPLPLERISTRKLIIKSVKHSYNDYYQSDLLWFQGTKQTYKQLAILICAVVFHPKLKSVHIDITHPASNIKEWAVNNLRVCARPARGVPDTLWVPHVQVKKFPFLNI